MVGVGNPYRVKGLEKMLLDANSGFRFEVQLKGVWTSVIAWDDYGDPYVLDVTHCKLTRVDGIAPIRAVETRR